MSNEPSKIQTNTLKAAKKKTTPNSSTKNPPKMKKNSQSEEMKSIMVDWHKPVYHRSSFSMSTDMVANTEQMEENQTMCRICQSLEDSISNQQVTPCGCSGSLQYVHMDCLRQWRLTQKAKGVDVSQCELCKQPYNVQLLGETDVPTNSLLKMQEDLKQLVRSGIYLMLLVKSWKNDLTNLQQNTQHSSEHSAVNSSQARNGTLKIAKQPCNDMNKLQSIEKSSKKTLNSYGLSSSSNIGSSSYVKSRGRNTRPSSNLSSLTAESSSDDDMDYVTREELKRRSENAWLRRQK